MPDPELMRRRDNAAEQLRRAELALIKAIKAGKSDTVLAGYRKDVRELRSDLGHYADRVAASSLS